MRNKRNRPEATPAQKPGEASQFERDQAIELLKNAHHSHETNANNKAVFLFRQAIFKDPTFLRARTDYVRFLIEMKNARAAEEVAAQALHENGANPDLLEMYIEILRQRERTPQHYEWAYRRLVEALPDNPEAHRGSLDFVIPYRLEDAYSTLLKSEDEVSRVAIQINQAIVNDTFSVDWLQTIRGKLSDRELQRVQAIVYLGRGSTNKAVAMLDSMPHESVPMNSLRRAIRRAGHDGKVKREIKLLSAYLKQRPKDSWATKKLSEYTDTEYTNYRLGKHGFPFPKKASSPIYAANTDKVFYLLHNSLPYHSAGYSTRTHGLLTSLNNFGWDVDGVTRLGYPYDMPGMENIPDVPKTSQVDNVTYRRLLMGREIEKKNPMYAYSNRYMDALLPLAKEHKPAIIHAASNHWNGLTAVSAANKLGLPSIYEVRGLWEVTRGSRNPEWAQGNMNKYMARMEADAARGATKVFAITQALKDELINRGVDGDKITVLPNGVDTSRFTPRIRNEKLASELGLSGKTVIGYVGSILDYEGLELLIEAAGNMASHRDDFHILFVGDGAELEKFKEMTTREGLNRVITFTGRVPFEEVEEYYSLIDITPFPRLPLPVCEMVSPLKPFEAMAMGKAVVASDVAALAEIVTPGENGLLHTKGDAGSLQHELELLLDNPELRTRLGTQARDWVVQNRDWSQIAQIVSDGYAELIDSARK